MRGKILHTVVASAAVAATLVSAGTTPEAARPQAEKRAAEDVQLVHRRGKKRRHPRFRGGRKPAPGGVNRHGYGYGFTRWAGDITIPGSRDCGKPVRAWRRGRVVDVTRLRYSYGKHVEVRHTRRPGNPVTLYAHMSGIRVREGKWIRRGRMIGRVGTTGNSTGCHLHFEIRP